MSNKVVLKKLSLNRETLRVLDDVSLSEVNGGTWGVLVQASVRFCGAAYKAGKWANDHAPAGDPTNPPSVVTATA